MRGPNGEDLPDAILFACSQNAVRSPMAEGIMQLLYGRHVYVDSVGVRAGEVDPFVIVVMDELGIDLTKHKPRSFDELEDTSFDLIVSLTPQAQHSAVDMTRAMAADVEYWPTHDPTLVEGSREQRLNAYREVRDALMARIKERFGWRAAPSG
ncbi:Arsenate reductase [Candidatus Phaeomarinobacter ectocarpi]|uniref:Arsenate reductase n=1 Tax=Candidatus Phaeomarinibacter ectocarpi TaxID=1458461 RepID=X5MDL1_9HYPH|nr:low molecular weight phosphatase family protein [Candidatus Phaeomarinobacter ectocarpi]CDO60262.1 Arsenate reductase [Candidatus Phaeomarinobacter ectocarpi]